MDIMHRINLDGTTIAVGHHQGFDIDPDTMMFEGEKEIILQLSPRKKSEWLASRELLFRIADLPHRVECLYDDFGKPYLKGVDKFISVSHSETWCTAMISNKSCGVDIQVYSKTVERIAERFLHEDEFAKTTAIQNKLHQLHLLWGAKECIYKAYGKRKLEFRRDIHITGIDTTNHTGKGEIRYEGIHLFYDLYFRILPEAMWVFCIQSA